MTSSHENIFRVTGPCAGNSPVIGEFPSQRPVTRSFDVSFDLRLDKRSRKQSWGWWFQTPSRSLWRHCNALRHFIRCMTALLQWHVHIYVAISPLSSEFQLINISIFVGWWFEWMMIFILGGGCWCVSEKRFARRLQNRSNMLIIGILLDMGGVARSGSIFIFEWPWLDYFMFD